MTRLSFLICLQVRVMLACFHLSCWYGPTCFRSSTDGDVGTASSQILLRSSTESFWNGDLPIDADVAAVAVLD